MTPLTSDQRTMSAKEVADALDISLPTLYAYVSRGLIRSLPSEDGKRQRRYLAADVEALLAKKEAARHPEQVADRVSSTALHWGTPVLPSAITLIEDGHLYYRGYDVAELARHSSFEQVATLIWSGDMAMTQTLFEQHKRQSLGDSIQLADNTFPDLSRLQAALALAANHDLDAYDTSPQAVMQTGVRILKLMRRTIAEDQAEVTAKRGLAELLARAWCPGIDYAAQLLETALILCADHELNASSFAARVVASAGATPYAVVIAGLSALSGTRHGGMTERTSALLRELDMVGSARTLIAERLRRGEIIPGFGHRLYPDGDPRAVVLLDALNHHAGHHPTFRQIAELLRLMAERGEYPTIDVALAVLERILSLPDGKSLTIFALGRTIGWIGHAIEQYEDGRLLRPRARYVGNDPH